MNTTKTYALIAATMMAKAQNDPAKLERIAKGLALAVGGNVYAHPGFYRVYSLDGTHAYEVKRDADGWTCDCPDFAKRLECCKHLCATAMTIRAAKHYKHLADDGTTVLLGNKALADAQRAQDEAAGGLARLACEKQWAGR